MVSATAASPSKAKKVREVDQLNFICYVNGTDYLADVRKALGM